MWIGGLFSAAIIVLAFSAYYFSNAFLQQYPIEQVTHNSSFACDVTLRNAKFSTTTQKRWDPRRSTKESQPMFDLLDAQPFTLNIDLVQTAFTCDDQFYVQRLNGYQITTVPITQCEIHSLCGRLTSHLGSSCHGNWLYSCDYYDNFRSILSSSSF